MIKPIDLQEPDAKCLYHGSRALSDSETMSLILAGLNPAEKVNKLLSAVSYNFAELGKYSYEELKNFGLSHLQAIRLIAVMEFSRRKALQVADSKPKIRQSKDAVDCIQPLIGELDHEEFWVLHLDRANNVIKRSNISKGGISGTVTDVRIVLKEAILCGASALIVAHNHPSGNLNPSDADSKVTLKIKDAGQLVDIQLLDHVIIAGKEYYSFADNGLI